MSSNKKSNEKNKLLNKSYLWKINVCLFLLHKIWSFIIILNIVLAFKNSYFLIYTLIVTMMTSIVKKKFIFKFNKLIALSGAYSDS